MGRKLHVLVANAIALLLAVDQSLQTFGQVVLEPILRSSSLSAVQAQLLVKMARDRPSLVPRCVTGFGLAC